MIKSPYICSVLVLALLGAVLWFALKGEPNSVEDPDGDLLILNPEPLIAEQTSRDVDRVEVAFPEDPGEAVTEILASYSGKERSAALAKAAAHYATQGTAAVEKFLLALPPGDVASEAIKDALFGLPSTEMKGMIEWAFDQYLSMDREDTIVRRAISHWAKDQPFAPADYFVKDTSYPFPESRREQLFRTALSNATLELRRKPERIVEYVDAMEESIFRDTATSSTWYIRAKLETGEAATVVSDIVLLEDQAVRESSLNAMMDSFRRFESPQISETLQVLVGSSLTYEEKYKVVSPSVRHWMRKDLNSALTWIGELTDPSLSDPLIANSWASIAEYDPSAAEVWIDRIEDPELRDLTIEKLEEFQKVAERKQ